MKSKLAICILLMFYATEFIFAMPGSVTITTNSHLQIGDITGSVQHCDKKWKSSLKNQKTVRTAPGYPSISDQQQEMIGEWNLAGGRAFALEEKLTERNANAARYQITLRSKDGIYAQALVLNLALPHDKFGKSNLRIDGREYPVLSSTPDFDSVKKIEIPHQGALLTLEGKFRVRLENKSKWNCSYLRFEFSRYSGLIHKTDLSIDISIQASDFIPLRFEPGPSTISGTEAGNIAEELGLPDKKLTIDRFFFELPSKNRKTGSILNLQKNNIIQFGVPSTKPQNLYLIHTVRGAATPHMVFLYSNGNTKHHPITENISFNRNRPLLRNDNFAVVAANNSSYEGVGFSRFPIPAGVKSISLSNGGNGNWFIVAGGTSSEQVSPGKLDSVFFIKPNATWHPFETMKTAEKGSILDFSSLSSREAGKFGWLKIMKDGTLAPEDAPQKRVRLFGVNYGLSAVFMDRQDAEKTVHELSVLGYNAVRLHPDRYLTPPQADSALDFDDAQFAKLDWLFYCFRRQGFYQILDLHAGQLRRNDQEKMEVKGSLKALLPISAEAMNHWKSYARKLLTHTNPHTQMRYLDDPVFYALILNNEDDIFSVWQENKEVEALYLQQYKKYLEDHHILTDANLQSRGEHFLRFLSARYSAMIQEMSRFLKKDLGYKGLVTDFNFRSRFIDNEIRNQLDLVDNHVYWDHPRFTPTRRWSIPYLHNQTSAISASAWNPRNIFATRIFGKPFIVSEFNYVFPNQYRAESGPLFGAYAALQNWDGLYRFAWSHDLEGVRHQRPINRFDISQDALLQISERIIFLLFMRGDVSSATSAISWNFDTTTFSGLPDSGSTTYPATFEMLGMYTKIGSRASQAPPSTGYDGNFQ